MAGILITLVAAIRDAVTDFAWVSHSQIRQTRAMGGLIGEIPAVVVAIAKL